MKDFLRRFLTYNDEANRRFIDTIQRTRPNAERIDLIVSHIVNAHHIWNTRIGGTSLAGGVWDVRAADRWSDLNQENFAQSLDIVESQSLDRIVDYKDTRGNVYRNSVFDILVHVVNHSSYHRGQLAILLGHEKMQPPVTDFIAYVREMK